VLDPGEGLAHWRNPQLGSAHAAIALDRCESGSVKHTDVLRHRGERHVEARRELADRAVAGCEPRQDVAPGRIGERAEGQVERIGMVNHLV
jgi:hypothetical protein